MKTMTAIELMALAKQLDQLLHHFRTKEETGFSPEKSTPILEGNGSPPALLT